MNCFIINSGEKFLFERYFVKPKQNIVSEKDLPVRPAVKSPRPQPESQK